MGFRRRKEEQRGIQHPVVNGEWSKIVNYVDEKRWRVNVKRKVGKSTQKWLK